jgi:hypothetical protein
VQPLDLPLLGRIPRFADAAVKRTRRLILQLLLPCVNLVGVNLIALRRLVQPRRSRSASKANFAFSAASILRRIATEQPIFHQAHGPKIGVHLSQARRVQLRVFGDRDRQSGEAKNPWGSFKSDSGRNVMVAKGSILAVQRPIPPAPSVGERAQDNDLIVIRDAVAATKFEAHFERMCMWDAGQPMIEFEPAINALEPK